MTRDRAREPRLAARTERRIVHAFMNEGQGGCWWSLPYRGEIEGVRGDAVEVVFDSKVRSAAWTAVVVHGGAIVHLLTDEEFRRLSAGYELRDASNQRFL